MESRTYRLPAEAGAVAGPVPAAISVENVKKTFIIPDERYTSFKSRAVALFRPQGHRTLEALDELSFEVQRGEFFGVVGPNGSGKSTLLRCIAGIYGTDAGYVAVTGRLSPFLEMGVGFKEEFTARENVVLNGTLLGLSPAQIRERMDGIIAFADLEQFADMNLKNFSSGMRVRLAFSLAIQVDADILLLDEVFAVGDEAFMQKCFEQFRLLKEEGRTVVLVTHRMSQISRFCDRALLLDSGRIAMLGDPAAVANGYSELNARLAVEREQAQARRDRGQIRHLPRRGIAFAGSGRRTTYSPSAFGDDLRELARVTATLAKAEFKLHYRQSVLGYLWSVMYPLMLFGVLYLVFSGIVGVGRAQPLPGVRARRRRPVDLLLRGDQRGGDLVGARRGTPAQDALPSGRHTAVGLLEGPVQPRHERVGGGGIRACQWCPASRELARAPTAGGTARGADHRHHTDSLDLVCPLPGHPTDLARARARPVLLLTHLLCGDAVPGGGPRHGGDDTHRDDLHRDATRVHRPKRSQRGGPRRGSAAAAGADRPLGGGLRWGCWCSIARRLAPRSSSRGWLPRAFARPKSACEERSSSFPQPRSWVAR